MACSETSSGRVVDPSEPPTVTRVAPGFNQAAPPEQQPQRPVASTIPGVDPDAGKKRSYRLHYVTFPALAGVEPGSRIDLVGLFPLGQEPAVDDPASEDIPKTPFPPTAVSMLLLQNTAVLDVRPPHGGLVRVGLAVYADELELLLLTASRGTITPLVRGPQDEVVSPHMKLLLHEWIEKLQMLQEQRCARLASRQSPCQICEGERGLVLPTSLPDGVLTPGTRVDIHGTFDTEAQMGERYITTILLQNVGVTAVDAGQVQLSVTSDEAQALLLAQRAGQLTISVRNPEEVDVAPISRKTLREALEDLEIMYPTPHIRFRKKSRKLAE